MEDDSRQSCANAACSLTDFLNERERDIQTDRQTGTHGLRVCDDDGPIL